MRLKRQNPMGMIVYAGVRNEKPAHRVAVLACAALSTFLGGLVMFALGDAVVPGNEPAVVPEASAQTSPEGEICSGKPQTEQKEEKAPEAKPTSIPKAGKVYRWHTDMPGAPVNNIISGISLNERVRFINALFGEDPILFQANISRLNAMGSLSEAEEYLTSTFPDWKLDSELVYLFMMAVRRKLR